MRAAFPAACVLLLAGAPGWAQIDLDDAAEAVQGVAVAVEEAAADAHKHSGIGATGTCPKPKGGKKSDRCAAGLNRSVDVWFELPGVKGKRARVFGVNDKNAILRKFRQAPSKIVIHNGGSARKNRDHWQGKRSGSHYTIDEDGTIFQHHGEEFSTVHADDANDEAIGIEFQTRSVKVGDERVMCNDMHHARLKGKRLQNPRDMDYVRKACAPTSAQYASAKALVADIAGRHGITIDEKSLIGHCEAGGDVHGDPRAFDWDRIGVDKAKKNALFKSRADMRANCWYYEP